MGYCFLLVFAVAALLVKSGKVAVQVMMERANCFRV